MEVYHNLTTNEESLGCLTPASLYQPAKPTQEFPEKKHSQAVASVPGGDAQRRKPKQNIIITAIETISLLADTRTSSFRGSLFIVAGLKRKGLQEITRHQTRRQASKHPAIGIEHCRRQVRYAQTQDCDNMLAGLPMSLPSAAIAGSATSTPSKPPVYVWRRRSPSAVGCLLPATAVPAAGSLPWPSPQSSVYVRATVRRQALGFCERLWRLLPVPSRNTMITVHHFCFPKANCGKSAKQAVLFSSPQRLLARSFRCWRIYLYQFVADMAAL